MTTYTTTFAGQTTSAAPTNFTDRYDSNTSVDIQNPAVGEEDDRVLQYGTSDSGDVFYSFDDIDGDANRDNCEILARFKVTGSAERLAILRGRASGTGTADKTAYDFYVNSTALTITRWVSGSGSVLTTTSAGDFKVPWVTQSNAAYSRVPPNQWVWMRFRINGTGATVTLQGRVWVDGHEEPTAWTIEYSDTNASRITAAGWCGLGKRDFTQTTYLDYFSVGTNGDSPTIATGGATIRATQVSANVMQQQTASAVLTQMNASVLLDPNPEVRVTQAFAEVMYSTVAAGSTNQAIQCIIMT